MTKTVKEIYQDRVGGDVTIEYSDDSISKFNIVDTVTAQVDPVNGGGLH